MDDTRLRILFFIDRLAIGGAQRQLLNLLRGIDRQRFQCSLVTLYAGGELEAEARQIPDLERRCLDRKGRLDATTAPRAVGAIRRFRPHIVYCFLPVASVFGLSAAVLCRTPVRIASKRTGGSRRTSLGDGLYRWAEIQLMRLAHAVVANSEAGRRFLISQGIKPAKAKVILNGLDAARLRADKRETERVRRRISVNGDSFVIGAAASLTPGKDHRTLLQAFALIKDEAVQIRLALAGDGPLRASLGKQAASLGLDGRVAFLGNQDSLGPFYAALDLLALSSTMPEGCSNALLEAMALGRPAVATDVGGNRELVRPGETGLLVPPGNPRALADAFLELLRDRPAARKMGARARRMVRERFSLRGMVSAHQELFESLHLARTGGR